MGSFTFVQIFTDIFLALGIGFIGIRMMKPQKDDPRLSRGLQLLQSKIAILEDLSDRVDQQVKQWTLLIEEKRKNLEAAMSDAEHEIIRIEASIKKSQETAKMFQDKIPHEEYIDRQSTVRYVKAAKMAHSGADAESIHNELGIPKGEAEFIVKVNRERLMFSLDNLPDWIKSEMQESASITTESTKIARDYSGAFDPLPSYLSTQPQQNPNTILNSQNTKESYDFSKTNVENKVETGNSAAAPSVKEVVAQKATQAAAAPATVNGVRPYEFKRVVVGTTQR